jgi:hypothetical protein
MWGRNTRESGGGWGDSFKTFGSGTFENVGLSWREIQRMEKDVCTLCVILMDMVEGLEPHVVLIFY